MDEQYCLRYEVEHIWYKNEIFVREALKVQDIEAAWELLWMEDDVNGVMEETNLARVILFELKAEQTVKKLAFTALWITETKKIRDWIFKLWVDAF